MKHFDRVVHYFLFGCLILIFCPMSGCTSSEKLDSDLEKLGRATGPVKPGPAKSMTPTPMAKSMQMEQQGKKQIHTGVIMETIGVPSYTYLRIKSAGKEELWAAIPKNDSLKSGQQVAILESVVMKDFKSRSLGKTFPSIVFGILNPKETGKALTPLDASTEKVSNGESKATRSGSFALPPGHPTIPNNLKEKEAKSPPNNAMPGKPVIPNSGSPAMPANHPAINQ